jgi:creatinine amidohydrolase
MEIVSHELRVKLGIFAVSSMWSRFTNLSDLFDDAERRHGIHAGEVATSVMMHPHPELVDMSQADDFESLSVALERANAMLTPEGAVGFGWQAQDLHRSGACSKAAGADAERGRVAVERAAERLLSLIDEIAHHPIERVVAAPSRAPSEPPFGARHVRNRRPR